MPKLRVISKDEIASLITLEKIINEIEKGFVGFFKRENVVFPVIREKIEKYEGIFGIKSGYLQKEDTLGFKAGGFWIKNIEKNLPTHQSIILLFDPSTGQAISMMDANIITILRTGAVGAIAAKFLARKNSSKICIIGAGTQGRIQLTALQKMFYIKQVKVYDKNYNFSKKFAKEFKEKGLNISAERSAEEAVKDADIIVTTTPSEKPIIKEDWIEPSVHINAIGADTVGKQELDPKIFKKAKIVVDDTSQCIKMGETQHAFTQGIIKKKDIYAELGEIIAGKKAGRESETEITLFDATGLAFQDLITANLVYKLAMRNNVGKDIII